MWVLLSVCIDFPYIWRQLGHCCTYSIVHCNVEWNCNIPCSEHVQCVLAWKTPCIRSSTYAVQISWCVAHRASGGVGDTASGDPPVLLSMLRDHRSKVAVRLCNIHESVCGWVWGDVWEDVCVSVGRCVGRCVCVCNWDTDCYGTILKSYDWLT